MSEESPPFKKLAEHFPELVKLCAVENVAKDDGSSFSTLTCCINYIFDEVMTKLKIASDTNINDPKPTYKSNFSEINCQELSDDDKKKYSFEAITLLDLDDLKDLDSKSEGYLLTSLLLLGALTEPVGIDLTSYETLKKIINPILTGVDETYHNKEKSSIAILALNNIICNHKNELIKHFYLQKAEQLKNINESLSGITHKLGDLFNNPPKKVLSTGGILVLDKLTGKEVTMSGGKIFIGGSEYKPRQQSGGAKSKSRTSKSKKYGF